MLVHLSIQNYAIVEQLDLDLRPGMTVVTGETGAGKSILLDALGLTLGDRADGSLVRPGAARADILASFDLTRIPEARAWLAARDLDHADGCLLRRVIQAEGRSRAYINGTPCPLTDLKALGALLIDIHSQHEHQSLLLPDTQRRLLDAYAGLQELAQQVQLHAQQWQHHQQHLKTLRTQVESEHAQQQLIRYQLDELEQLALESGEIEALEAEYRDLGSREKRRQACHQVLEMLDTGDDTLSSRLSVVLGQLTTLHDPELKEVEGLLDSARIQIEEAASSLTDHLNHLDEDPERQAHVQARLDLIYTLARKHRIPPAELTTLQAQLNSQAHTQAADAAKLQALEGQTAELLAAYQSNAKALSAARANAAGALAQSVTAQMQRLGMPGGQFEAILQPSTRDTPRPQGDEDVDFRVSANPGHPPRALGKVASGGELSRISLAIQVVTAQTSLVPTLVFDEVDVGVGGPTAEIVGQLLRQLGAQGQVITVTHLPQVAAQGHAHLYVSKHQEAGHTRTSIRYLSLDERTEELARMLGGARITPESRAHARNLLENP